MTALPPTTIDTRTPLELDAGAMLDAISELVDAFDSGRIEADMTVSRKGVRTWLIDEVLRAFADKHADAKPCKCGGWPIESKRRPQCWCCQDCEQGVCEVCDTETEA